MQREGASDASRRQQPQGSSAPRLAVRVEDHGQQVGVHPLTREGSPLFLLFLAFCFPEEPTIHSLCQEYIVATSKGGLLGSCYPEEAGFRCPSSKPPGSLFLSKLWAWPWGGVGLCYLGGFLCFGTQRVAAAALVFLFAPQADVVLIIFR